MFRRGVPIGFGDAQPFVHSAHLATRVNARPASGHAELIKNVLTQALLRIVAEAGEEFFEALVGR